MRKTLLTIAPLIGMTAAGGAMAQGLEFDSLDADASGEVSFEELQVALPDVTQDDFNILDVDGSGGLSQDEFAVLLQAPAPQ